MSPPVAAAADDDDDDDNDTNTDEDITFAMSRMNSIDPGTHFQPWRKRLLHHASNRLEKQRSVDFFQSSHKTPNSHFYSQVLSSSNVINIVSLLFNQKLFIRELRGTLIMDIDLLGSAHE